MAGTDINIPYYARIKQIISVLRNGPVCPGCGKKMKSYGTTGLGPAIQTICDIISGDPLKWVCKTMKPNPKYPQYVKAKQKYDQQMAEIQRIKQENENRFIFKKKVPQEPKKPSPQPAKYPCGYAGVVKVKISGDNVTSKVAKYWVYVEEPTALFPTPGLKRWTPI